MEFVVVSSLAHNNNRVAALPRRVELDHHYKPQVGGYERSRSAPNRAPDDDDEEAAG